ncbi:hypothetical protein MKW98_032579, partial [Papaver atlanticum]
LSLRPSSSEEFVNSKPTKSLRLNYVEAIKKEISKVVELFLELDIDVQVHGERGETTWLSTSESNYLVSPSPSMDGCDLTVQFSMSG